MVRTVKEAEFNSIKRLVTPPMYFSKNGKN